MKALQAEWVNGFLFVGNQLALDFLNTKLLDGEELVEKLSDWKDFAQWCKAADVGEVESTGDIGEVREFRERLREAVVRLELAEAQSPAFLAEMNSLLLKYPVRVALNAVDSGVEKRTRFVDDGVFWGAIAASIAELLTEKERHRVRKCEHCMVQFYDVSKKGSRRWCSMGLCGNRLKVAAYQKRRRGEV